MSFSTKIGIRSYEFDDHDTAALAHDLYLQCDDQESFEDLMEQQGIEFSYDLFVTQETFYEEESLNH